MNPKTPDFSDIINRLAELARLRFSPAVQTQYTKKLKAILSSVEKLSELKTSHIELTSHVVDATASLRPDDVVTSELASAIVAIAPERYGDYFEVPKVIDA